MNKIKKMLSDIADNEVVMAFFLLLVFVTLLSMVSE